ncbi:GNAT family N-acetyltransferase [Thalassospira sp.]|uniref:GNAT family N-acetyltransferase n=1 Tax=Thalassospira sp. TaxID=1912094 RepID=UPI0027347060|nr:GNAT family N-acetyltransferase [Thalassospira sp.]MDP2697297.1 GNAT family N-acetyltransferase [Thalassospira sp.]
MTIIIRTARPQDAALFPDIERQAGEVFRNHPDLAWVADDDVMPVDLHLRHIVQNTVWLAMDDAGLVVGFVTAGKCDDALHIWQLAVLPRYQGQGTGRHLMAAVRDHAVAQGLSALTLTTFCDVPWNDGFYAGIGFDVLSPEQTGARLAGILAHEAELGLPPDRRCAMRLTLANVD